MDKYDLKRFNDAQKDDYGLALREIQSGQKRSHWIWYIFPQLRGLGNSYNSQYYGISCLDEAKAYLEDGILGGRLREISAALLKLDGNDPVSVMGSIDALKLHSSMTLFNEASKDDVFAEVLDKYYGGRKDGNTLKLLKKRKPV
ncbi:MAG: DUF1810 domain-containing protein [Erysipelotrichaceae bacterium]|nr:DUF1810 domain-containing protein [Erysipelotrichaceae bacterium]